MSCFKVDLCAGSHEALKQRGRVGRVVRSLTIRLASVIAIASTVNIDCRRRYIILLRALPYPCMGSIIGTNRTIGSTQINANIVLHSILPKSTVPVLRMLPLLIITGSIICVTYS